MPANAADHAANEARPSSGANGAAALSAEAQSAFQEAAQRFEKVVQEGVEQIRAQVRTYADTATHQIDEAQRYVTERVKERPLAASATALGVGVIIGLLLAGGRRR